MTSSNLECSDFLEEIFYCLRDFPQTQPSSLFSVISGISGATDPLIPPLIVAIRTNAALDPCPFGATQQYSPKTLVIVALHINADLHLRLLLCNKSCSHAYDNTPWSDNQPASNTLPYRTIQNALENSVGIA